jgi:aminomuconate-semialdehyde/2-hydroxymuconate-6-semialdehyde dehydrogenase
MRFALGGRHMGGLDLVNAVGGRPVAGDRWFDKISPVDGSLVARVNEADRSVVDRAVEAARAALRGDWAVLGAAGRVALLRRIADRIDARAEEFVAAEVADTGKPASVARSVDVARASANFRMFADLLAGQRLDAFLTELPDGGQALNYAVPKPVGVVAIIVPWNLPLLLLTWKLAPALACGNTVIVKPSEETPSSAALLATVIAEAGAPDGVVNVVHGFGPGSAGEFLTTHEGVDAVTFTGESATGSAIMRAVAPTVKALSFELGGKNAAVVFGDADLERAVAGVARSTFTNTGQVCLCTERVYVDRSIYHEFVDGLVASARRLRLGRPYEAGTTTGPLISRGHREKVLAYYDIARADGADVLTGGGVPDLGIDLAGGAWVEPTVLAGLDHSSRLLTEEVFGPVCAVLPFDDEEQAISYANDSAYGLAAAVWTGNLERAHRVAQRMDVGIAWVNTWFLRDLRTPFGGRGRSGIGREGGEHSMHFYSEPTNVCVSLADGGSPRGDTGVGTVGGSVATS